MWIRGQDKETLTNANHLAIRYLNGNYSIYTDNHLDPNTTTNLGTYSTKEKAMKVLDMIQERIRKPIRINTVEYGLYTINDYDISLNDVFQMPQDDEVN